MHLIVNFIISTVLDVIHCLIDIKVYGILCLNLISSSFLDQAKKKLVGIASMDVARMAKQLLPDRISIIVRVSLSSVIKLFSFS